jgi:hypothetical protein
VLCYCDAMLWNRWLLRHKLPRQMIGSFVLSIAFAFFSIRLASCVYLVSCSDGGAEFNRVHCVCVEVCLDSASVSASCSVSHLYSL